ncbi:hypothetical protein NC651_017923 [Populus alba x Populus x berolinensis]|nr:hypothetical protein NC651_017923 [Populus alba x Populus x berolinensis]
MDSSAVLGESKVISVPSSEYHDKKERPDHLTTHTQVTFSLVSILEKVKPHYHSLLEDSVTKTSLSDTEGQYEVEVQWSKAQRSYLCELFRAPYVQTLRQLLMITLWVLPGTSDEILELQERGIVGELFLNHQKEELEDGVLGMESCVFPA